MVRSDSTRRARSNAGGGGERVLWTAVAFVQRTAPEAVSVVYSGDAGASKADIVAKVEVRAGAARRCGLTAPAGALRHRAAPRGAPRRLPRVAGPRRGRGVAAAHAAGPERRVGGPCAGGDGEARAGRVHRCVARLRCCTWPTPGWADTMGYAFTFYVVRLVAGVPVGAYVHYPTISTEMVHRVRSRTAWHTNSGAISSSAVLSRGKQLCVLFAGRGPATAHGALYTRPLP